ncbi:GMC family oxidoreductase [Solirubrobacter taibaiensis]|nr:GMC family oxidoreductase [Solirubrobacter taibaiensis]
MSTTIDCDIAIIGSGMGGSTLAWALRQSGARVVIVERGGHLPREPENWSPSEVFAESRYKNAESWEDGSTGEPFKPGVHYYVGGNTKVFGACLPRFREEDFGELRHQDGVAPAWPVSYAEMEPYYVAAERLFGVHGTPGGDPTEPWRSADYPYPALEHEPPIAAFAASLAAQGLQPFLMPMGVDRREGGACIQCRTCDGYPCKVDAKSDAEVRALRPALAEGVGLITGAYAVRLISERGRVREVELVRDGEPTTLRAERFVVSCGAVNSAALLMRSGLANSSDLLGRNYMVHNSTFFMAVDPRKRNTVSFQKTLGLNDWYLAGEDTDVPLGNVQMLGKLQGPMLKAARRWLPMPAAKYLGAHSVDLYLTTEDLPERSNHIVADSNGGIRVHWRPNNLEPHRELKRRLTRAVRKAGFPLVFTDRMDISTNSHQCGTAVMGEDPAASVLDVGCRTHDVENLWVVDSACFPSSTALNPALTIAANALRVADRGEITS